MQADAFTIQANTLIIQVNAFTMQVDTLIIQVNAVLMLTFFSLPNLKTLPYC